MYLQEMRKRQGMRKATSEEREQYMEKLYKANLGLLWYLEWKKCLTLYDELQAKFDGSERGLISYCIFDVT